MNRTHTVDVLRTQGIMAKGYGIIPQLIARDERLTPEAKSIYCYFSSFAGAGFEPVFPSRDLMLKELNMSKDRYYRHLKLLIDCNYITVERVKEGNLYSKNIYTLVQLPNVAEPSIEGTEAMHVKRPASIKKRLSKKQKNVENNSAIEKQEEGQDQPGPATDKKSESAGNLIRVQLGIDPLIEKRPECKDLIESIYLVVEDMAMSEQITINGSIKKKQAIRKLLENLRMTHVEILVNNITCSGQKIRNKKAYIQSCIGNVLLDASGSFDFSKPKIMSDEEDQKELEKEKQQLEYKLNPDLIKLDQRISQIGIDMSKAIISGDELKTAALRKEMKSYEEKRDAMAGKINVIS